MVSSKSILQEEKVETDVLVIGAGAGGMMAAITAADSGARVTLCEKGNARRSGGITGGNDHFFCYIPEIHGSKFRSTYIRENIKGIADEDLAEKHTDLSYSVLRKWESWGVDMKKDGHYEFTGHSWPGSSGNTGEPGKTNRLAVHFSDNALSVKLEKQMKDRGVCIMNRVMITEPLFDSSGRITGAVGISTREPKFYVFQAKSVIVNKGGVNSTRLYPSPNVIGYSMAEPGTGDGVIFAYKAGADLQNAEFFHQQISLRFGPMAGKGTWVGIARDSESKPIAPPYLSKPDAELGDMAIENADAVDQVWATGKGPVWMDPRGISAKDEQYMRWGFESEALTPLLRWLDREKIDTRKTRFEFISMQPGTSIQPRVDRDYRTTIAGLCAVLPGSLSESAVGGLIAGESAAKDALATGSSSFEPNDAKIQHVINRYEEMLNRSGNEYADWREAQWATWQLMHCYALPPRRTENTLDTGHNHLLRLRNHAREILKASNQHDLYHCLEVFNLMDVAELVLLAVKERKESRGRARRQDYPFINPLLNKLLVITNKDGIPSFRWEKPRRISG